MRKNKIRISGKLIGEHGANKKPAINAGSHNFGGLDGTRTRDLCRDRAAF